MLLFLSPKDLVLSRTSRKQMTTKPMSAGRQEAEEQSCKKGSSFYPLHICQAETKSDDQKRLLFDLRRRETL